MGDLMKKLSEMSNQELWNLFPIILSDYKEIWVDEYEHEKENLIHMFSQFIKRINHIGSTSVIGLSAKPTIDILLEIDESTPITWFEEIATSRGYLISRHSENPRPYLLLKKGYTEHGFDG